MAKKITGYIKLQVPAGIANPSPPIGPALGQRGVNIMEFCKAFNAATQELEKGAPIPTVITVYADRSFSFTTKTPPASFLLKKAELKVIDEHRKQKSLKRDQGRTRRWDGDRPDEPGPGAMVPSREPTASKVLAGQECWEELLDQGADEDLKTVLEMARDQYTTLPSVKDRPLYVFLDAFWRYADVQDAVGPDHARYVAPEQVRDLVATVFHQFVSMSIQHLMHEMGQRLLARFPQLAEVSFDGQNRLWDTVVVSDKDDKIKSYCDPRPPYGSLHLTLRRA